MKDKNFIFLEAAMNEKVVVNLVERTSLEIWHRIPDATSFEHTCYVNIGKELLGNEVKSIPAMALHYINRAAARHLKRSKYEPPKSFSDLAIAKGIEDEEYEIEDVLANVLEGIMQEEGLKETVILLAQDDRRKNIILTAWAKGFTDNREISCILADTLGGKSESHRKFIQRFRKECRTVLPAQAV